MPRIPVIAIFDIGKTNKKLLLFDEQYNVLLERSESFTEIKDEDGDSCEDLALLTDWIKRQLHELAEMKEFSLKAVNFSGYGASFVHIDHEGKAIAPLYNYLKPYPESLKKEFYDKYGGELAFSMQTASPILGSLNSGLQLYKIKMHQPELFNRIHYSLHLPQYLSFLVTGQQYSDITSIGCHTAMWNFKQNQYHEWLYRENILNKLPPIFPSDQVLQVKQDDKELLSGVGLHDSSSALIPYLSQFNEPFILISTGTWCISLNPFNQSSLTADELQKDCLCYMEYRGNPIKASRLFAGHQHEQQVRRLAEYFHCTVDAYKHINFDPAMLQKRSVSETGFPIASAETNVYTGSEFANTALSIFGSYAEAYHELMMEIAIQQVASTRLIMNKSESKKIFIDGGFSNNPIYTRLLAMAFPEVEVYAASISQASALGAALAIHQFWNKQEIPSDLIQLKPFNPSLQSHS
jgi:sugar (pentulose or hexulose) kinase